MKAHGAGMRPERGRPLRSISLPASGDLLLTMTMLRSAMLWAFLLLPAGAQYLGHDPFAAYTAGAELQSAGNPEIAGYSGGWLDIDFGDSEPTVTAG